VRFGQLPLELVDLGLVGGDLLLRGFSLRLELGDLVAIVAACRRVALLARRLGLELHEPPLRVLPVAVEVAPDHPDDREEEEDAGGREDNVQEVDVVCVPDAFLFSHDQMLKKISGIATTYFRLKIHRASILRGSDIIIRNSITVT